MHRQTSNKRHQWNWRW